jgi:transcriptional regulator with XRE-family HTH domain
LLNLTPKERQQKEALQIFIGAHLRAIRIRKNLRQKEVAQRSGFSNSSYNLVEKGQRNLTLFSLYKISKALDEPMDSLLKILKSDMNALDLIE